MTSAAWRSLTSLGELTLLFMAALRGPFRRPFYWRELLEQCRFILTANYPLLLFTGLGFRTIVSLEAGHFSRAASAEYRLGAQCRRPFKVTSQFEHSHRFVITMDHKTIQRLYPGKISPAITRRWDRGR